MELKIFEIIEKILKLEKGSINLTSNASNTNGWDSLNHMKIILAIEETFLVSFTDKEIVSLKDVSSFLSILNLKIE